MKAGRKLVEKLGGSWEETGSKLGWKLEEAWGWRGCCWLIGPGKMSSLTKLEPRRVGGSWVVAG